MSFTLCQDNLLLDLPLSCDFPLSLDVPLTTRALLQQELSRIFLFTSSMSKLLETFAFVSPLGGVDLLITIQKVSQFFGNVISRNSAFIEYGTSISYAMRLLKPIVLARVYGRLDTNIDHSCEDI